MQNDSIDSQSYRVDARKWAQGLGLDSYGNKRLSTLPLSDYHVYGCDYTPGGVKYFFDGELVQTVEVLSQEPGSVRIWLSFRLLQVSGIPTWSIAHACLAMSISIMFRFLSESD